VLRFVTSRSARGNANITCSERPATSSTILPPQAISCLSTP